MPSFSAFDSLPCCFALHSASESEASLSDEFLSSSESSSDSSASDSSSRKRRTTGAPSPCFRVPSVSAFFLTSECLKNPPTGFKTTPPASAATAPGFCDALLFPSSASFAAASATILSALALFCAMNRSRGSISSSSGVSIGAGSIPSEGLVLVFESGSIPTVSVPAAEDVAAAALAALAAAAANCAAVSSSFSTRSFSSFFCVACVSFST
mmetsp:Transcript_326/g.1247  ORF Transcript_326/g.1247 Transcript_326/m.1247 type:complete len:211 (-) Transcript_326:868-1500(-)